MLEQFKIDWNTAKQKRRLLHPSKVVKGVVVFEQSVITFRGVDIHMSSRLVDGDETKPQKERRYTTILEVPSTGKRIPMKAPDWPTMALNIRSAITPGDDHERRTAQRMADIAHLANKRVASGALEQLQDTVYTDDEKVFIRDWLDNNVVRNRIDWNQDLLQMLIENQNFVTGRFLIEKGVNLYEEASRYIPRCYDKAARLLLRVVTSSTGAELLPVGVVQREIFSELDPTVLGKVYNCVFQVNALYKDVCRRCGIAATGNWKTQELVFMVKFLADFYARMTGVSVEKRMQNVDVRKRRNTNSFNGGKNVGKPNVLDAVTEETGFQPLSTGEDLFGDVLDQIKSTKPSPKRRQKKDLDAVADGLIGDLQDKIDNQAKAKAKKLRNAMKPVDDEQEAEETSADTAPADSDESSFGSIGDAFAGLEIKEDETK